MRVCMMPNWERIAGDRLAEIEKLRIRENRLWATLFLAGFIAMSFAFVAGFLSGMKS